MNDNSDDEDGNEISFSVKFLGRVEVVRPEGMQVLNEAAQTLKMSDKDSTEKLPKKSKVSLFLSMSGIDILEHKTKFMLYTCPLPSVSFCAILPATHKVFGFVAKHPAANTNHCYLFQSKKFSHLLVSIIGDAFRASQKEETVRGGRDLVVEALRHKNKVLQRENAELRRSLSARSGNGTDRAAITTDRNPIGLTEAYVRVSEDDKAPLLRNT